MSKEFQKDSRTTRTEKRTKRRKTNIILNSLIGIVLLLIIIISINIFFGNDEKSTNEAVNNVQNSSNDIVQNEQENIEVSNEIKDNEVNENSEENEDKEEKKETIVTEGGSDSNVKKTIVNPNWKPVGTSQSGEHSAVYDESSADWNEMVQALSYATGLSQDNMTLWYLGNNNHDPQKSIGTVSSKSNKKKYRVFLEWVEGEGWKPSKVEELKDLNIR